MHDLVVDDVVGDRQQRADEGLVAGAPLGRPGLAVERRIGQLLGIEPALRAGWHDNRVLDPLRFHQPEDLGAEIVAPVGPAQAAARDGAAAQVDPLDPPRIDEDFAVGDRLGQVGDPGRIDLEGQRLGGGIGKGIGAQDRIDQRVVQPQQAVVVDRLDLGEAALDRAACLFDGGVAAVAELGIVPRGEQRDQRAGHVGRGGQRVDHGVDGETHPGLAQIAIEGAQPIGLARRETRFGDQPVEGIVLGFAVEHRGNGFLDRIGAVDQRLGVGPRLEVEQEVVDRAQPAIVQHGGHFRTHVEPEILQRGHAFRQGQAAFGLVQLEPQAALGIALAIIHPRAAHDFLALEAGAQIVEAGDVERGFAWAEPTAETGREMLGKTHRQRCRARAVLERGKLRLDRFAPPAQQRLHLFLERRLVGCLVAVANVEDEPQRGEIAALDLEAPVEQPRRGGFLEQRLDFQPDLRGDHVARQPDEGEQVARQRRLDQRKARTRAVDQAHHGDRDAFDVAFRKADQQVVRQRGQRMDERLARMAAVVEAVAAPQHVELAPQARHIARRGRQRGAGPDPRMQRQRDGFAIVLDRHDEQVERDAAVDIAEVVGLDDQRAAWVVARGEPGEGAVVGCLGEQLRRALAADAELVFLAPVAVTGDMAQLRQHARIEPFEQFGALFAVADNPFGIGRHRVAQLRPVGHRRAYVAQRQLERFLQLPPGLRIDPRGLDVDHRFAIGIVLVAVGYRLQASLAIALDGDHRVDQPVDRQAQRGDGRRDRIDEERHVLVDDRDPRQPPVVADAFDRHGRPAARALGSQLADESGGIFETRLLEGRVAGQQRQPHAFGNCVLELLGQRGSVRTHTGPLSCRRMIVSAPRNNWAVSATT